MIIKSASIRRHFIYLKIYQKQAILQEVAVYTTPLFEKLGFVV